MKEELKKAIVAAIVSSFIAQMMVFVATEILKAGFAFFGSDFPFDPVQFFQAQFPLWTTFLVVSIVALTFAFVVRSEGRKKRGGLLMTIRTRPLIVMEGGIIKAFNVDWNVILGYNRPDDEPYGFVESGPLCPKCKYEMDYKARTRLLRKKKGIWHCLECGKEYDVPEDVEDPRGAVEKLVDADYRKKRHR